MIPLFKVPMSDKVAKNAFDTLYSGMVTQGPKVKEFERQLSIMFDNPYVLTTGAGTHALHLALRLANIGPGDEVITTPLTCTATNMPILMQGADIVWADVKPDFNIDPVSVESKITEKTKAIICMHWGGYPCDLFQLSMIANEYNLFLIEDAAHAYLSTYWDTAIGSCNYSDFTMFSFQAIKALTCVDGGTLFCKNEKNYDRGKLLRWYGIDREGLRRDMRCEEEIIEYGYKYHMNDLAATIGLSNMDFAIENVKKCQNNAKYFEKQLDKVSGIELTQIKNDRRSSYWLFTMLVEDREAFVHKMESKGIHVSKVHERNDKHEFAKKFKCDLPQLDSFIDKMICIPVGWWLTSKDKEYITKEIRLGW